MSVKMMMKNLLKEGVEMDGAVALETVIFTDLYS